MLPNGKPSDDSLDSLSTHDTVLMLLVEDELSGYQLTQKLASQNITTFATTRGLIYPLLHQIEKQGLIQGEWKTIAGRHRRYYTLTRKGHLTMQAALQRRFSSSNGTSSGGNHHKNPTD